MERISTIQTANVITQPTDATERLTLVEKLEREKEWWHDDGENNVHRIIDDCIDIVKQHQAESGWVACSERMPSENELVLLYAISAKDALPNHWDIGTRFKVERTYYNSNVREVFWQPLPQPPSEV